MPRRAGRLPHLPLVRARRAPLRARLVGRRNRFVAEVELAGGERALAHLANTGRLTGTLRPGGAVLLDGPFPARRCPWSLVAAREGRVWVGTVPVFANQAFAALWRAGRFPELPGATLTAEVVHGRSRFDLAVDGAFVEVKSATLLVGRAARFPDAVTARGARHCDELRQLAARGQRVAIVLMAQRGDVDAVGPQDEVDPAFGAALRRAAAAGVLVLGCALDLEPAGLTGARRLPVLL